jgi:hypothetical protein
MTPTYELVRAAKQFIRNSKLPSCSSCDFYKENAINKKKELLCTKIGVKNIISGSITYDKVYEARFDNDKCGEKGEHFIEKYVKN